MAPAGLPRNESGSKAAMSSVRPSVSLAPLSKSRTSPVTQILPAPGALQLQPLAMPLATQRPLVGSKTVLAGSHTTRDTHTPPTISAVPPSTSQG